jgi:5-hydroxyisourate hydrolase
VSAITTHVLDVSIGRPAPGVAISLEYRDGEQWSAIGSGVTDTDGRLRTLVPEGAQLRAGTYRLVFDTGSYFLSNGTQTFFPSVIVTFELGQGASHHHVPLLVSPFGYSTYLGS